MPESPIKKYVSYQLAASCRWPGLFCHQQTCFLQKISHIFSDLTVSCLCYASPCHKNEIGILCCHLTKHFPHTFLHAAPNLIAHYSFSHFFAYRKTATYSAISVFKIDQHHTPGSAGLSSMINKSKFFIFF